MQIFSHRLRRFSTFCLSIPQSALRHNIGIGQNERRGEERSLLYQHPSKWDNLYPILAGKHNSFVFRIFATLLLIHITDMAWIYLILGGVFEIGWPLGFKLADTFPQGRLMFIILSVISMALSGFFLYLAQRSIPIGTAYAVWTGLGAVGTLFIGILVFNDPAGFWRLFSAFLIIAGIIGLKLA